MYSVKIRDHVMIAHSLPSPVFGPAQQMHGATYVIDAEFSKTEVDENNIVIDMGLAHQVLKEVLQPLAYQNLDLKIEFAGQLTTTEFLAKYIHDKISEKVKEKFIGHLKVTLGESHIAWASYAGIV